MTGYSLQGVGQWPQGSPVYPYTLEHLFVDPVNGQDFNNPSGAKARPLRTMQEVSNRLVGFQGRVDVHMRNADYPLPPNGTFLQSRMLNGLVRFLGDDVWDPTLFTEVLVTTAQAGTTPASIVVTGPLTIGAFDSFTIEVTSGGVVRRRTIRNNTATEIVPCWGIFGAAPGDAVRVLRSNARFTLATALKTGVISAYIFAQDCPAANPQLADIVFAGFVQSALINSGLVLEAVTFGAPDATPWLSYGFGRLPLYTYGLEVQGGNTFGLSFVGTRCMSGIGLEGTFPSTHLGWGMSFPDGCFGPAMDDTTFIGTSAINGTSGGPFQNVIGGEKNLIQLISGRWARIGGAVPFPQRNPGMGTIYLMPSIDAQAIPPLIDSSGNVFSFAAVDVDGLGTTVNILAADIRGGTNGGLLVRDGAQCFAATGTLASTVAGDSVAVRKAGRLIVEAPATMGDAVATDWVVEGQPAFNRSVFAAAGVGVLGTDSASLAVST